jgi:hypothetical protein
LRDLRGLGRSAVGREELVERAVSADDGRDVAWIDDLVALEAVDDVIAGDVLRQQLWIGTFGRDQILVEDPALLQHPHHQVVELGQRLRRSIAHERLELLPLAFPVMPIEPWFDHGRTFRRLRPL